MNTEKSASRPFWLTIITFTFAFSLYTVLWTYSRSMEAGIILPRSIWGGMLLVYFGTALICIWFFLRVARFGDVGFNISSYFERFRLDNSFWRALGLIVIVIVLFLIPYVKFSYQIGQTVKKPVYDPIMLLILFYWMCWWAFLLAMTALKVAFKTTWQAGFACALVIFGVAYEVFTRFSALVTTYPLSMGWSEMVLPVPATSGSLLPPRSHGDPAFDIRIDKTSLALADSGGRRIFMGRCESCQLVSCTGDDCNCHLFA